MCHILYLEVCTHWRNKVYLKRSLIRKMALFVSARTLITRDIIISVFWPLSKSWTWEIKFVIWKRTKLQIQIYHVIDSKFVCIIITLLCDYYSLIFNFRILIRWCDALCIALGIYYMFHRSKKKLKKIGWNFDQRDLCLLNA